VEVDPAWERAAEEFLYDELEYIVLKPWPDAEQAMAQVRSEMEGRATFVVEGEAGFQDSSQGINLPRLADLVNFTNGLSGQTRQVLPRLARCYVASEREEARSMAEAHPEDFFLLPDGQCYHGRMLSGGRKKSSGPLGLKREMREYAAKLKEQERTLNATVVESEEISRANSRISVARLELDRLKREEDRARESRAANLAVVEKKDEERAEREQALESV